MNPSSSTHRRAKDGSHSSYVDKVLTEYHNSGVWQEIGEWASARYRARILHSGYRNTQSLDRQAYIPTYETP